MVPTTSAGCVHVDRGLHAISSTTNVAMNVPRISAARHCAAVGAGRNMSAADTGSILATA